MIFQDNLWVSIDASSASTFKVINISSLSIVANPTVIYDHVEDSDDSITDINTKNGAMLG